MYITKWTRLRGQGQNYAGDYQFNHQFSNVFNDDGTRKSYTLGFDSDSYNATAVYQDLFSKSFTYDNLRRVQGISQSFNSLANVGDYWTGDKGTDKSISYEYFDNGRLQKLSRVQNGSNNAVTELEYFVNGQSKKITHFRNQGGESIAQYEHEYNSNAQLDKVFSEQVGSETNPQSPLIGLTTSYFYDSANQLKNITQSGQIEGVNIPPKSTPIEYDKNGNRNGNSSEIIGHDSRMFASFDLANSKLRYFEYDKEGRLTKVTNSDVANPVSVEKYTWDHKGRLVEVEHLDSTDSTIRTIQYAYDALDRKIGRIDVEGATEVAKGFIFDRGYEVAEVDLNDGLGKFSRVYLRGINPGEIVAVDESASATLTYWAFEDLQGAVKTIGRLDNGGAWLLAHRNIDIFGNGGEIVYGDAQTANGADLIDTPLLWSGYQRDSDTGFFFTAGRWYDPVNGRYLNDGGGINGYVANGNNPVASFAAEPIRGNLNQFTSSNQQSYEVRTGLNPSIFGNPYDYLSSSVYGIFGDDLAYATDTQLRLGTAAFSASVVLGGYYALGGLLAGFGSSSSVSGASYLAAATTQIAYTSLGVSSAQVLFSGGSEGKLNLALDTFGVGFLRYANSARGLAKFGLYAGDIGVNAYQGIAGSTAAYSDFRRGNFASGSLNFASGLLGFSGAAFGGRNLRQLLQSDPTTNPFNYRLRSTSSLSKTENLNTISPQRISSIRDALSDTRGRLLSKAERQGVKFTIRRLEAEGFRLDGAIKFNVNQGIDLAFTGTGRNAGRFALAEAKKPGGLGSLTRDSSGIRQGSYDFFQTRLERAGRTDLLLQLESGNVDLFGGFQRSGRLFQFNPDIFIRDVNFRTTPGAAILVPQ